VIRTLLVTVCLLTLSTQVLAGEEDADVVAELAAAELPDPPQEDPPEAAVAKARTDRLQKALRCPVCQGLSVADSPSTAARAMGDRIQELVEEGYTEEQITEYFVDRYGAWVELEPPSGEHQALFYAPIAAIGLGAILLLVWSSRRREDDSAPQGTLTIPAGDPTLAPWRARILAELGEE